MKGGWNKMGKEKKYFSIAVICLVIGGALGGSNIIGMVLGKTKGINLMAMVGSTFLLVAMFSIRRMKELKKKESREAEI